MSQALEEVKAATQKMKVGLMLGTCYIEVKKGKEFCFNQVQVNAAQEGMINAQSGLIDARGMRTLRVPDTGTQFFTVTLTPGDSLNSENIQTK